MTDDDRYALQLEAAARRNLAKLPEGVAAAAIEFITGPLLDNPYRLTKALHNELEDERTARRGEYRILCRIDDEARTVTITAVKHRRDAYRPR